MISSLRFSSQTRKGNVDSLPSGGDRPVDAGLMIRKTPGGRNPNTWSWC